MTMQRNGRPTKRELKAATKERQKLFVRLEELARWGRDTARTESAYNAAVARELQIKRLRGEA